MIEDDAINVLKNLAVSNGAKSRNIKSQIGQDVFVLLQLLWKHKGYFVEFGAANGKDLSNTYLLEKDFSWKGILAEPLNFWHEELKINRNSNIDFECVWKETGKKLKFVTFNKAEFSTLNKFVKFKDKLLQKTINTHYVKTISLIDLLKRYNAPRSIDYLSIDTEGSEYEILENFDFNAYEISIITCEHNYSKDREKIYKLLFEKGFVRVYKGLSKWDDWYINKYKLNNLKNI